MTKVNRPKLKKPEKIVFMAVACLLSAALLFAYYDDAQPRFDPQPFVKGLSSSAHWDCYNSSGEIAQAGETISTGIVTSRVHTETMVQWCAEQIEFANSERDLYHRCRLDLGSEISEVCVAYRSHFLKVERERTNEKIIQAWKDFKKDLRSLNKGLLSFISEYTVVVFIVLVFGGYWWMKRRRP